MSFRRDLSLSAVVAGFVAMLVGVTSSIVVVFQAAQALGATPAQVTSWIWSICVGTGLTSIGLSLWYRRPVLTAWATPGAAMLVSAAAGVTMPEAVGGFIVSALLITLSGVTGLFARVMDRIPQPLAAGLIGAFSKALAGAGAGDLPGHAQRAVDAGDRLGVLGRGGGRCLRGDHYPAALITACQCAAAPVAGRGTSSPPSPVPTASAAGISGST
jgi:hypothetical protein